MIELVLTDRCNSGGKCEELCSINVFDLDASGKPVVALQEECHSCYPRPLRTIEWRASDNERRAWMLLIKPHNRLRSYGYENGRRIAYLHLQR